jgi:hypothetical protein
MESKPIPPVAPKPISDEKFHRRSVDTLSHAIFGVALVIFMAEVILVLAR